MLPNPLTHFGIQKCYGNEPKFNVYSRKNLSKIKDGAYIINLYEYESIGFHLIDLYVNDNNITYFNSFGVEHMPKEIRKFIENKNIITNIYKMQECDLVMLGYFCVGINDFMLKGKGLLECRNLFSPNDYQKNEKILLNFFQ